MCFFVWWKHQFIYTTCCKEHNKISHCNNDYLLCAWSNLLCDSLTNCKMLCDFVVMQANTKYFYDNNSIVIYNFVKCLLVLLAIKLRDGAKESKWVNEYTAQNVYIHFGHADRGGHTVCKMCDCEWRMDVVHYD